YRLRVGETSTSGRLGAEHEHDGIAQRGGERRLAFGAGDVVAGRVDAGHEDAAAAEGLRRRDVTETIADEHRARDVELEIARRVAVQQRARLAALAGAAALRLVRAVIAAV